MAFTAFLVLKLADAWLYYCISVIEYVFRPCISVLRESVRLGCWTWPPDLNSNNSHAKTLQKWLQKHVPAVKSALVEFHKAQCFFMLAIQVAALVVLKSDSLLSSSRSLQELHNNHILIGHISISGFLPVTFIQFCLHDAGMRSWYLLVLSVLTVAASAVTLYTASSLHLSAANIKKLQSHTTNYRNCGNLDPAAFCLRDGDPIYFTEPWGRTGSLVFCLVILAVVVLDQSDLRTPTLYKHLQARISNFTDCMLEVLLRRHGVAKSLRYLHLNTTERLYRATIGLLFLVIWVWFTFLILGFFIQLSPRAVFTISTEWTFGQIVALTVWAAPLIECLKLLARGFPLLPGATSC